MNSGRIYKTLMEMATGKKHRRAGWTGTGLRARFPSILFFNTSLGIVIKIKLQNYVKNEKTLVYQNIFFL